MKTFPTYLPSPDRLASLKKVQDETGRVAIVEVAGRDSVAAMVKHAEKNPAVIYLPTIVATGTEYGDFDAPLDAIAYTQMLLPDTRILEPVRLFSPDLWRALNGRYGAVLAERYPSWSPCAACHLYVHLMRAPLAFALKAPIVTGERDTHDGRYKLSQTPEGIDAGIDVLGEFGITLFEPIQSMHSGKEIEALVGKGWEEGERQLECVHSGSFKDASGGFAYDETLWRSYLDEFAIPAARLVLNEMQQGRCDVDWVALIGTLLKS